MNKTFHSVWNASKQAYVAAAETVSAKGKPSSGVKVAAVMAGLLGSLLGQVANAQTAPPPNTLPTGGQVSAGQASISQSGANMVIQQSSNRASVNWQSFNVGKDAHVQFNQPSAASVTFNRVMSADPSQIFGRITANGQVVLSNPAGVYFGKNARVDVGSIVATTHGMSDADFMAGKNRLERNGSTGKVVNEGEIKAALGGYIALLAPEVRNQGAVIAHMGTVALAAGEAVDLQFDTNNRLTSIRVEPSQIAALVDNRHAVQAQGGLIIISAQSMDRLVGGVVKNSGRIEANGLQQQGGRIVLSASKRIDNTGTVSANATTAAAGSTSADSSPAGRIEISAPEVNNSGSITATGSPQHSAGSVQVQATHFTQADTGRIDLSAPTQGGALSIQTSGKVQLQGSVSVQATQDNTAATSNTQGGQISIEAQGDLELNNATLDASGGQGGQIHLRAGAPAQPNNPHPYNPDSPDAPTAPGQGRLAMMGHSTLTTRGRTGQGGGNTLQADHIALLDNTTIDAQGATGGGHVLVGGDWQGGANEERRVLADPNALHQATTVTMTQGASINASATQNGDGGTVVLWSDVHRDGGSTEFAGQIQARGGAQSGHGGHVETSGNTLRVAETAQVNTTAPQGTTGHWLLDPTNFTISAGSAGQTASGIGATTLVNNLTNNSITIETSAAGAEFGNIDINADIVSASANNLTFKAHNTITQADLVDVNIGGHLTYWADSDNNRTGSIVIGGTSSLSTRGGNITLAGGADNGSGAPAGSAVQIWGWWTTDINSNGGNITMRANATTTLGGVIFNGPTTVNAGTGRIVIDAQSDTGTALGFQEALTITSASNGGSAISIRGITNNNQFGVVFNNDKSKVVQSTGTGSIDIVGQGNTYGVYLDTTQILAASGAINIKTDTGAGTSAIGVSTGNTVLGQGGGIANSSSAINITTNRLDFSASGGIALASSGTAIIQPSGASFSHALDTARLTFGSTLSGLTLGKTGNEQAITLTDSPSIAGPISLIGSNITLNSGLTSTASGAEILIKVSGDIITNANTTAKTITTNNGNVVLWGDGDANGSGVVNLDHVTVNPGSGNVTVRAETVSWNLGTKPAINGTGVFTFEPSDASFGQGVGSDFFTINSTLTGLNLGKTGNTSDIGIGFNTSIAGPVNIFASAVSIGANLTTTNTTTGDVTFNAATVTGSGNIALASGRALSVTQSGNSTYSGIVSGTSSTLTKLGAGTLTLTGANSFTGATTITTGALQVGDGGTTGALGTGAVVNNAALTFNRSNDVTVGGDISGTGTLTKLGAGTLTLTGTNSYSGVTTITAGTLQVGSGGTTGSLGSGTVTNDAALTFNRSNALTVVGNISGTGTLTNLGAGTTTLSGVSSYTGATTITSGGLVFSNNTRPSTPGFTGAGQLTIEPSTSFSAAFNTNSYTYATTLTGLTFGKSGNASNITVGSPITISGPIYMEGGGIDINANLTTTVATGHLTLKTTGFIQQANGVTVTTQGGNQTYWANSGSIDTGSIVFLGAATLLSNGGHITLAGGAGSSTPTGGAYQLRSSNTGALTIHTGGGDLLMRSVINQGFAGMTFAGAANFNSGTGSITIDVQQTGNGRALAFFGPTSIVSSKASGNAITITASAAGQRGLVFESPVPASPVPMVIKSTSGGAINITATGASTSWPMFLDNVSILSASGDINIDGGTAGIFFKDNGPSTTRIGAQAGEQANSSSKVTITGSYLNLGSNSNLSIDTTGQVIIQPSSTSFTSALDTTRVTFGTGITALTLGKTGNTSNITIGSAVNINGPIAVEGGVININANLTSTGGITGAIIAKSRGNIAQAAGVVITTNGGDLTFWTDSDETAGGGVIFAGAATLNTGGGDITLAGGAGTTAPTGDAQQVFANTNTPIVMNTGGGDLLIKTNSTGNIAGVQFSGDVTLDSGSGSLTIEAKQTGTNPNAIRAINFLGNTTIRSAKPNATAISITGGGGDGRGIFFPSDKSNLIQSTGAGGNIFLRSNSLSTNTFPADLSDTQISSAGTVTIESENDFQMGAGSSINSAGLSVNIASGKNFTLLGTIAGSGSALTKLGAGTLTLSGANTYTGITTISAGTLRLGAAGGATNTPLGTAAAGTVVAAGATLDLNGFTLGTAEALTINGTGLSSAGALTNSSASAATYSGLLTLGSSATIRASSGHIVMSNAGTISGSGFGLTLDGISTASSLASILGTGAGTLTKLGTGTWTLVGDNTNTGITTISDGTLQVGAGGLTGTLGSGAVTNNAALSFNRSNDLTVANTISGTGTLNQLGAGTLTLTGTNSYTGATTITAGTLQVGNGDTTGTLGSGAVTNNSALSFNRSDAYVAANIISGSGSLTKLGAGTLTLSGASSYTGLTTISAGALRLGAAGDGTNSPLGTIAAGTVVESGATLDLYGFSLSTAEPLSITGAGTGAVGQRGALVNYTTTNVTYSGLLSLGGSATIFPYSGSIDLTNTGTITGSGYTLTLSGQSGDNRLAGILDLGAGGITLPFNGQNYVWTLSGANTYTGPTNINGGTLRTTHSSALGNGSAVTIMVNNSTLLDTSGSDLTIGSLASTNTSSATRVSLGSRTLTIGGNNTSTTFAGVISGDGAITKVGTGTLTLSGPSNYTGATTVSAGTLAVGNATALGTSATGTTVASGATLDLRGLAVGNEAVTINGGTLAANSINTSSSLSGAVMLGANSTFNVGSGGDLTLSGLISGGFDFTKTGTGILVLSGSNTYTGTTNISAGTLRLGAAGDASNTPLGTTASGTVVANGASLDLYGFTLGTAEALTINGLGQFFGALTNRSTVAATYSGLLTLGSSSNIAAGSSTGHIVLSNPGTITGSGFNLTLGGTNTASSLASILGTDTGGLTKSGTGTWTLTGDNTYTGTTTVSEGTLQVGSGGTTGALGSGAITNNATLTFNRSNDLTVASAISGTGALTKLGAGTLTLTGTNSYVGVTTITTGTLRVGDGGTTGTLGSGAVTNNAALSFNRSDSLAATNAISGTGTLTKLGAGTLTLSGVSSYTGATTITSGGLVFSNNTRPSTTGFSGAGQLTIEPSTSFSAAFNTGSYTYATTLTSLTFGKSGNTSDINVSSAISVAGPVTVASAGLITLSAGITSAATSGTGISLTGQKINQNGNGVVVQTAGANISYTATNVAQTSAGDTGIGVLGTNPNLTPASINAGGGNITLNASFAATGVGGGSDYAIRLSAADLVTSGTGSITLTGNASNVLTSSTPYGVELSNSRLIAGSGGLTVNYSGNLTSTTSYGVFISSANRASQLLAPSGDISLVDQTSSERTTGFHYSVYFGATSLRPNIGAAAGSAVTTSSANLTIQGDILAILDSPIVDTTGAIVIEPVRSSFTFDLYTSQFTSIRTASSVRWGKAGNTSNIIVNTALNAAGPISLYGGNLTLQAGVSTPSGTLTLQATNSITHNATGFVSAASLLLGGGNVTLTHNSNNISTLAASSIGNLSFFNSSGMTIGTVGATSGISSTGTISVATNAGNLTLASNLSTTNATSNAILINAGRLTLVGTSTGGDLIVSGSPVLTAGTGGTIRLMTGSVSGSTGLESLVGSGSGRFRYNSDETSTGYTTALSANVVNAIYRERPAVTVAGTSNVTITYGDSLSLSGTATGTVNGDTLTMTVANPQLSTAGLLRYSATPYSASSNLGALGYNVSGLSSTVTVNRKALTVTGLSSANKTYNGLTTATVSGTAALQSAIAAVSGVSSDGRRITSDTVSLSGTATGTFNSKDVASATTVTFTGLSLSGADSANYTLTPASASYSITPKALSITTPSIASKVYDGSTAAGTVTVGTLSGLVTGETVTATGSATALSSANAASYTTTVSYTLANGTGLATNYSLANSTNVAATIGRATLTVRANDDAKFLTQSDTANFAGVSYTGFVNGETASVLSGTPTVTRSNASNSPAGTYTSVLQPGGLTLGNYQYNYVNGDFTVVGSNQMLVRVNNASTTYGTAAAYSITSAAYYNGTNVVTLGSGVGSIVDLGNNRFTVNDGANGSATFTVVPSGSQITSTAGQLKVGSYQLQGTSVTTVNAANFSNNLVMVGSHAVATKAVTASIAAAPSGKVYDGNTSMASLVPLSLSGLVTSDVVTANGVGSYANRNAGTSLNYTVDNLALAGADAANYRLAAGASLSGTNGAITAKAITLNPQSTSKTYDGASTYTANSADLAAMSALLGVSGDTVAAATLAFADKNVGSNKTLTATAATIADGNGGNNYTVTLGSNSTSAITRLNSVTWVGGASGNWFDPANWAGGAVPDLANVANVVIPSGVTVSFGSSVVAPAQSGAVSIDGLTGAGGNLSQSAGSLNVGAGGITLGSLTQTAGTMVNTGSTTLDAFTQSGGSFAGTGNMTTASFAQTGGSTSLLANLSVTQDFNQGSLGSVSVGGNATITDTVGGLQLGNFSSTGALVVNSTDGAITQASGTALTAQSTSSFTATQGGQPAAIDLSNAGNDFGGAVSLSGSNVSVVDANALTLGNVTATGNLNATAATDLAVNGVVSANTLTLTATTGNITQGAGSTITVATGPSNFVAGGTVTLGRANSFTGSVNGWGDNSSPGPVPPGTPETPETPQVDTGNTVGVILSGNARSITSPGTTLTSSSAPPELVLSASAGTSSAKSSQQSNVSNANSEGVTIDVRNAAVQDEPIMAAVSLPKGSATSGTGFSFELPSNIRELVQTPDNVQATLPNGGPLPAWLKFNVQALRFEASAVPDGAFPMQVAIQLGKQRVMVVISERTE